MLFSSFAPFTLRKSIMQNFGLDLAIYFFFFLALIRSCICTLRYSFQQSIYLAVFLYEVRLYSKQGFETISRKLQCCAAQFTTSVAISRAKDQYHCRLAQKLCDPSASAKTMVYFENLMEKKYSTLIILLLLINNKLESDFRIKANYFNSFLASKCTPFINSSTVKTFLRNYF